MAWKNKNLKFKMFTYMHCQSKIIYSHTLPVEHKCNFPGCKNVMVLDGNMKNQREVCLAKDAGYISYPGLPGRIKTGCMASPSFKSHFCTQHKIQSCNPLAEGEGGNICMMYVIMYCDYASVYVRDCSSQFEDICRQCSY